MADITVGSLKVNITGDDSDLKRKLADTGNELNAAVGKVGGLTKGIGELKAEYKSLSRMSLVGKTPEQIKEVEDRLAELRDQIGDYNAKINSMSQDPFQKVAEGIKFTSSVMAGAAGVASFFGGEQERLNAIMQKTVALIGVAQAAQSIADFTKQNAIGMYLKSKTLEITARIKEALTIKAVTAAATTENAVKSKGNLITQTITKAQWLWNAAIAANPIGLLITGIAALGAGIAILTAKMSKSNDVFDEARKKAIELGEQAKRMAESNKYELDLQRAMGLEQVELNKLRIKQIDEEVAVNDELIRQLQQQSLERKIFGGKTKEAKEAEERYKDVQVETNKLLRERAILFAENIKADLEAKAKAAKAAQDAIDEEKKRYAELLEFQRKQSVKAENELNASIIKQLDASYDAWKKKQQEKESFLADSVKRIKELRKEEAEVEEPDLDAVVAAYQNYAEKMANISNAFNDAITSGVNSLISNVGEAIGEFAAGAGGIDTVFKSIGATIADFTSMLGKALIAAGVGAIAFKKLLLNPASAIIAGGALVAIGAFIRSKLATGPGGSEGGYSPGIASTGSATGAGGVEMRTIYNTAEPIRVTGRIEAEGAMLAVVLDNYNSKRSF